MIEELIARINHACVVMWSIANEPASNEKGTKEYFEPLINLAREQDPKSSCNYDYYATSQPDVCQVQDL